MSCKNGWQKFVNFMRGQTCISPGQANGTAHCIKCYCPLTKAGLCPKGHSQTQQAELQALFSSASPERAFAELDTSLRQLALAPAAQREESAEIAQGILQAVTALVRVDRSADTLRAAHELAKQGLQLSQQLKDRSTQARAVLLLTDVQQAGGPRIPSTISALAVWKALTGALLRPGKDRVLFADVATTTAGAILQNDRTTTKELQRVPNLMAQAHTVYQELGDRAGQLRTLRHLAQAYVELEQPAAEVPVREEIVPLLAQGDDHNSTADALRELGHAILQEHQARDPFTRPPPGQGSGDDLADGVFVLQNYHQGLTGLQRDLRWAVQNLQLVARCYRDNLPPETVATLEGRGLQVPSYAQVQLLLADAYMQSHAQGDDAIAAIAACEEARADSSATPAIHEQVSERIRALLPAYTEAMNRRYREAGRGDYEYSPDWLARKKELLGDAAFR